MSLEVLSSNKSFGGWHRRYSHASTTLNCNMRFAVFLPPQVEAGAKVPVLYWLSGLTCNEENFMQKGGVQQLAAELGIAVVAPDTSPRGEGVADDPEGAYDLGLGAGFYVNATQAPWASHYKMYDYIVSELPALINAHFPVSGKAAISGHSMGGHGALMIALRNPDKFVSVSALSPISHPCDCPWGQKALSAYLGEDQGQWQQYDASLLMQKATSHLPTLVDQGDDDEFLVTQLKPETLEAAAAMSGYPLQLRRHPGYDHSFYFITSFIADHLRFHAQYLK